MSRMNGQFTFQTPSASTGVGGDNLNSTATVRTFTATERTTLVEVGLVPDTTPSSLLAFTVSHRVGGTAGSDSIIAVFKAAFAAEGGVSGDPSVNGFDNANQIPNGIITNTAGDAAGGKALRAYCEASLEKGDQIVFKVTTADGSARLGTFYAKAYPMGAGLVESNDVDSN